MKKIEKNLVWTFWEKIIEMEIFKAKSKKIILNIHWVFGSKNDFWQRNFAENISKKNKANVVLFTSSRRKEIYDENLTKQENREKIFSGKSFYDEVEDAKIVLKNILKNSEKYFWEKKEDLEIFLNGNSLWWSISFYLAKDFPFLKNISTVWTWLRKQKSEVPILDTFPDLDEYSQVLKNFSGKYLMNEAWNDEKFTKESYKEFFEIIWSKQKEKIFYSWVNHTFLELNAEKSEKPFLEVSENFVKFFNL